jgi:hypothetical protein
MLNLDRILNVVGSDCGIEMDRMVMVIVPLPLLEWREPRDLKMEIRISRVVDSVGRHLDWKQHCLMEDGPPPLLWSQ